MSLLSNSSALAKVILTNASHRAEEMAIKFPDVYVKSIDVAPTIQHVPRPNLHHEVYDVHEGIMESDGTFDIVHARHTIGMVSIGE